MADAESFLKEMDQECPGTRKMLERAPEAKFGWKPHAKSMTLGVLCGHLAGMFEWMGMILTQDEMDFKPEEYVPSSPATAAENLARFDAEVTSASKILQAQTDESLARTWRMKIHGQTVIEMPRSAVLRSMIFNHLVHHRGQLSVYLRLLDVPLPALYGPSADENA